MRRGKRDGEKKGVGAGGVFVALLGTGGIGFVFVNVLDHAHAKQTVTTTISTCTPNDTKNCECGNQSVRTCASDGLSWSRCNCDPVAVSAKTANTREEFCVVATAPPRAVLGCYGTSASCREQQRAFASQTDTYGRKSSPDADCVANPKSFACLTWQNSDGVSKMWCYASMDDCADQGLGECAWVSRDEGSTR